MTGALPIAGDTEATTVPSVAFDAAGNAIVAFTRATADTSQIVVRRWDETGQTWEDEVLLVTVGSSLSLIWARAAIAPSGVALVVWGEENEDGVRNFRARAYE